MNVTEKRKAFHEHREIEQISDNAGKGIDHKLEELLFERSLAFSPNSTGEVSSSNAKKNKSRAVAMKKIEAYHDDKRLREELADL